MDAFLISHRILRHEVEVVNMNPKEMIDALIKGKVDAVSTWNPHVIRLQKELGAKGLTFYGEGIYTETFNITAAQDFVHKNPETIKRVLSSLIRAVEFIRENPDKARRIISNYIKMDEAMIGELWGIYHFGVTLDQSLLITLEDQARWAIKNKLTDKTEVPNYLNFIYQDGLKAVKPEAVTIIR
ncbi:MAG: ABC transporter substrate-binding protein [Desulfobacterales bacterium]|nr:ABC transporter substrate-binding protein [Desulfobacterales bacterium]